MCMVLFAWLVMQDYFKEMTDQDIRRRIYEEQRNQIEQDMAPFGFIDDGMGDDTFMDADGDLWAYGDKQEEVGYMWNYWWILGISSVWNTFFSKKGSAGHVQRLRIWLKIFM